MKHLPLSLISMMLYGAVSGQVGLNVNLSYNWNDTTLPSSFVHDNRYNEIWGFTAKGREYAIIGSTMGTHIFDITDPGNTDTTAFIPGAATGTSIIHRDYHDYKGFLYIVCDEDSGATLSTLQIVDLKYLPDSVSIVYDSNNLFRKSHNIFIDSVNAKLYACGVRPSFNDLEIYSLTDPTAPVLIETYDMPEFAHDVYVRNDTAYINDGTSGLFIVDFSVTGNPVALGSFVTFPDTFRYNHSGWLNNNGTVYAVADEKFGYDVHLLDVSDLSNISILSVISSGVHPLSIPHNLIIRDDYLYLSYYNDGLYIFDISDPLNPVNTGYYDTSTEPHEQDKYRGAWGVYPLLPSGVVLVSDMANGLYVLDVTDAVTWINDEVPPSDFKIMPNPFTGHIQIALPQDITGNYSYHLLDITGRQVLAGNANSREIVLDTKEIKSGVYLLQLKTGTGIYTWKLTKI